MEIYLDTHGVDREVSDKFLSALKNTGNDVPVEKVFLQPHESEAQTRTDSVYGPRSRRAQKGRPERLGTH